MAFLKNEWKTLLFALWIIGITLFLVSMKGQINELQHVGGQLSSTLDSVESIVISTDANIARTGKQIDGIHSSVEFVAAKIRGR